MAARNHAVYSGASAQVGERPLPAVCSWTRWRIRRGPLFGPTLASCFCFNPLPLVDSGVASVSSHASAAIPGDLLGHHDDDCPFRIAVAGFGFPDPLSVLLWIAGIGSR